MLFYIEVSWQIRDNWKLTKFSDISKITWRENHCEGLVVSLSTIQEDIKYIGGNKQCKIEERKKNLSPWRIQKYSSLNWKNTRLLMRHFETVLFKPVSESLENMVKEHSNFFERISMILKFESLCIPSRILVLTVR